MNCSPFATAVFLTLIACISQADSTTTPSAQLPPLKLYTEEWPPITYSENNKPKGYAVELIQKILTMQNQKLNIQVVPWARGWKMITTEPNIVLFTMTLTPQRQQQFTLIGPVAIGQTNFYATWNSQIEINTLEDIRRIAKVGVYRDAVEQQLLEAHNFNNLVIVSKPVYSAQQLVQGRIDLWCTADLTIDSILKKANIPANIIKRVFTLNENLLYIAFSKGTHPAIINNWHQRLQQLHQNGWMKKLHQNWLPLTQYPKTIEKLTPSDLKVH
ncbi:substrate-binding periplasmic protein [Zooshikella harenae]|uniref:ABC transporter substrate-binding protein n=1 Tax=Zooshikella harenae TaxID=2827238 RepID=A0ABS5ZE68_9GAMM|nr:ABC transporter substrate-binding protein [Zooshikella harenae]MBU2711601.1 ABC transporter substrate-binding protein [Zooshikella harenae]